MQTRCQWGAYCPPPYWILTEYNARRILYVGSYRLMVLLDPTGAAAQDDDLRSEMSVLHCKPSKLTDTRFRS